MENKLPFGIIKLKAVNELDGRLVVAEAGKELPFGVKRAFWISSVPENAKRANHACKNSDFVIVCVCGSVRVTLDDGIHRETYMLDTADIGLLVPRMTWMETADFSEDAVMLVLASDEYQPGQYYEEYENFLAEANKSDKGREK